MRAALPFALVSLSCCPGRRAATETTMVGPPTPVAVAPPAPAPVRPPAEPAPPELVFPEAEHRKQQPPSGTIADFKAPAPQRYTLKNGLEVFHVEAHDLPTVTIELVAEGGAIDDPAGKEGLASLCAQLMSEGTEKLDKVAYEEALGDLASRVASHADRDQHGVSMASLSRNLDATLDIWVDTILHPGMRQPELDRLRSESLDALRQEKASPEGLSGRIFQTVAWGEKHPYGRLVTEASLGAVTLEDCKQYPKTWFKPKGSRLFVVGDVTRAQIEEKVGGRLAAWKGVAKRSAFVPKAAPRAARIFFVDVPGASQTQVTLFHPGPPRKAKDYFATRILSSILGGSFASRINMSIREEKGWAYGAYGSFAYTRVGSQFEAGGSIKTEHTVEAIQDILAQIEKLKTGEPTDDEFTREKEGTILALPARFATASQIVGSYRGLLYFGLPLDYFDHYVKNVRALDKAAVKKAGQAHLQPAKLKILVVGDGKTVLAGLKALGGELVTLDPDGKVVGAAAPAPAR